MPRSFSRFLSNRYNDEREHINERYQAYFRDIPNIPLKPRSTLSHKGKSLKKSESNIQKRFIFLYGKREPVSDWRQGDDISIVVRREMEERLEEQLMPIQPIWEHNVFSHTIWKLQMPEQSPILNPRILNGINVRIITAVAKPKRFGGRKAKALKKLSQKKALYQAIEPPEIEKPPKNKKADRRHVKQKGELFSCSTCSKNFNHSWMLTAHMRVHTGERPFVCPEPSCQRSFADRSNLRTHQRSMSHHNWEYQCGQCGKYFNQMFYLNRHTLPSCRKYLMTVMHRKS